MVIRFAVDKMLGRLARWLRIIGQDVVYGPEFYGLALVQVARRDGRVILTRDTRLVRRRDLPPYLFITSDHHREQFRMVVAACGLDPTPAFLTRCLDCNDVLCEVDPTSVRPSVPPYVWATQERFYRCPRCQRIFWPATHFARMRAEVAAMGLGRG